MRRLESGARAVRLDVPLSDGKTLAWIYRARRGARPARRQRGGASLGPPLRSRYRPPAPPPAPALAIFRATVAISSLTNPMQMLRRRILAIRIDAVWLRRRRQPDRVGYFSSRLTSCHKASSASRSGPMPRSAASASTWRKRRSNFAVARRSAVSGSMSSLRARLAAANSRSPISSSSAAGRRRRRARLRVRRSLRRSCRRPSRRPASRSRCAPRGSESWRPATGRAGRARPRRARSAAPPLARCALGRLVRLPGLVLRRDRGDLGVAEHMRVAPHHLVGDRRGDVVEGEQPGFLGHAGMEHDLKQQIAELVLQRRHVAALDRIGDLIGLLDRVGRDRREILLAVPRAAALRVAQPRHDREQPVDRAGHLSFGPLRLSRSIAF